MRPPHCAGEIAVKIADRNVKSLASMRPPHCAGEILRNGSVGGNQPTASMRPPHCAGEIKTRTMRMRISNWLQ